MYGSDLFAVSVVVPTLCYRGQEYRNVNLQCFVYDTNRPENFGRAFRLGPINWDVVNARFTEDEVCQFEAWLPHSGQTCTIEETRKLHSCLPVEIIRNHLEPGQGCKAFEEDAGYNLPFKVHGFFDVRQDTIVAAP